jgi:hypothetical protein
MLRIIKIGIGQRTTDNHVNAREDDVVHRRQRNQQFRELLLIPHIACSPLHIGAVQSLHGIVHTILIGRDYRHMRACLEQQLRGAIANSESKVSCDYPLLNLEDGVSAYPEVPPTTMISLPTSLSVSLPISPISAHDC